MTYPNANLIPVERTAVNTNVTTANMQEAGWHIDVVSALIPG
jgi:hypothetical protein